MTLDQECFQEHMTTPDFQYGVERGWWDVVASDAVVWPHVVLWIAAPIRPNAPDRYHFRFFLKDYPEMGPTATVWNPERNERLDLAKWPKGIADVRMAFRIDWNNAVALYVPWDRVAMAAHADWATKHPGLGWKRTRTIVHYLRLTHELLASEEYHGC